MARSGTVGMMADVGKVWSIWRQVCGSLLDLLVVHGLSGLSYNHYGYDYGYWKQSSEHKQALLNDLDATAQSWGMYGAYYSD